MSFVPRRSARLAEKRRARNNARANIVTELRVKQDQLKILIHKMTLLSRSDWEYEYGDFYRRVNDNLNIRYKEYVENHWEAHN
jgi:hypothetical protein